MRVNGYYERCRKLLEPSLKLMGQVVLAAGSDSTLPICSVCGNRSTRGKAHLGAVHISTLVAHDNRHCSYQQATVPHPEQLYLLRRLVLWIHLHTWRIQCSVLQELDPWRFRIPTLLGHVSGGSVTFHMRALYHGRADLNHCRH